MRDQIEIFAIVNDAKCEFAVLYNFFILKGLKIKETGTPSTIAKYYCFNTLESTITFNIFSQITEKQKFFLCKKHLELAKELYNELKAVHPDWKFEFCD